MQMTLKMTQTIEEEPAPRGGPPTEAPVPDRRPAILCADDDPEVLALLKEYLTHQGFDVLTATNGMEALFQVARRRPRAVILDLCMPRPGGLIAVDRIMTLHPDIPILLISGVPNVLELLAEAGVRVAGAFRKPLDLVEISGALARAGVTPPGAARDGASGRVPPSAPPWRRKRALVVDDEPEIREILAAYLGDRGYEVRKASSGREALGCLPEFRPDIVLLDIVMPGLSGVETLRRLKALPERATVIVVSGREDAETLRMTLAVGADDYVPKPVDFGYLDSVLELHAARG